MSMMIGNLIGLAVAKHRIAIQREADMIEAHGLDEGHIRGGVTAVEMLFAVALRSYSPRKPMAQVDAML